MIVAAAPAAPVAAAPTPPAAPTQQPATNHAKQNGVAAQDIQKSPGAPSLSGVSRTWVDPNDPAKKNEAVEEKEEGEKVERKQVPLREFALSELLVLRPEALEKGSAYLKNPDWPPMNVVNGIASIFIHDFFLISSKHGAE